MLGCVSEPPFLAKKETLAGPTQQQQFGTLRGRWRELSTASKAEVSACQRMARFGLFRVRLMDDILVLSPTRWKIRKVVNAVTIRGFSLHQRVLRWTLFSR